MAIDASAADACSKTGRGKCPGNRQSAIPTRRSRPSTRASTGSSPAVQRCGRTARGRVSLGGGAGLVRRRALPAVERHPERPHPPLGGGNRRHQRLSQAVEYLERQYARPSGPACDLRAPGRGGVRTEYDGSLTVILDRFDGKRLNSPNDAVVQIGRLDLVHRSAFRHFGQLRRRPLAAPELPTNVYRVDGASGGPRRSSRGAERAERPLLLAGRKEALRRRFRSPPRRDPRLRCRRGRRQARQSPLFVDPGDGTPDGFRCDVAGNLWCGWGMSPALERGRRFRPRRTMIGRIALPESVRQSLFRRGQAQPPDDGGEPVALRGLCWYRGCGGRLNEPADFLRQQRVCRMLCR